LIANRLDGSLSARLDHPFGCFIVSNRSHLGIVMIFPFSLRTRLIALFGCLAAAGLGLSVGAIVLTAHPRVEAEVNSSMRLSMAFLETFLAGLQHNPEPGPAIGKLVAILQNVRHTRVFLEPTHGAPPFELLPEENLDRGDVPVWFVQLVHPTRIVKRIQTDVGGRNFGTIVVVSYPWDEIAEVWDGVTSLAWIGTAIVLAGLGLTFALVDRWLRPIQTLCAAFKRLERGDLRTRIDRTGSPEFANVSAGLNHLAETLEHAKTENRLLLQKLISVQDDERKQLARELHDEFGSHLFAIRANTTLLTFDAKAEPFDAQRVQTLARSTLRLIDTLQRVNRRILGRLRPAILDDLGLAEAIRGLVAEWRSSHPNVTLSLSLPDTLDAIDDPTALTIYRVVQEGLTNIFRHANATRAEISVSYHNGADDQTEDGLADNPSVRVTVRDNGVGMSESVQHGLGLLGMKERLWGMGGTLKVECTGSGGVLVQALIPAAKAIPPAARADALFRDRAQELLDSL
jgi:two-component system sensor histidine kinase UhpB